MPQKVSEGNRRPWQTLEKASCARHKHLSKPSHGIRSRRVGVPGEGDEQAGGLRVHPVAAARRVPRQQPADVQAAAQGHWPRRPRQRSPGAPWGPSHAGSTPRAPSSAGHVLMVVPKGYIGRGRFFLISRLPQLLFPAEDRHTSRPAWRRCLAAAQRCRVFCRGSKVSGRGARALQLCKKVMLGLPTKKPERAAAGGVRGVPCAL